MYAGLGECSWMAVNVVTEVSSIGDWNSVNIGLSSAVLGVDVGPPLADPFWLSVSCHSLFGLSFVPVSHMRPGAIGDIDLGLDLLLIHAARVAESP